MARYPASIYQRRKRRIRRLTFTIVVLVVGAAVVFYFYSRRRGRESAAAGSPVSGPVAEKVVSTPAPQKPTVGRQVTESAPEQSKGLVEPQPAAAPAEFAAEPSAEPNETVAGLIAGAMALLDEKPAKIIEARDRLNELLPRGQSDRQRAFIKQQLAKLSQQWLFSRQIFSEDRLCAAYRVKPGDLLSNVGKRFNVPYQILMQINGIAKPEDLQAGTTIKVINGPFHARVYRSSFTMDLFLQNTYVRSFAVGLGKPGMETPTGRWRVKAGGKLIKPTWTDPVSGKTYLPDDPDYPLGSRWIGLEGISGQALGRTGFAIHGTKDPEQIGTAGSQGCIRLHNGNAILMYNLLMPGVSLVDVVD